MSCCGPCKLPSDPKCVAAWVLRITFGLSALFIGLSHYMTIGSFSAFTASGLGPLSPLGTLWAYIYPGLLVIGGALFVLRMYVNVAVWAIGVAFGSVIVGMLLKPLLGGIPLSEVMPATINMYIYFFVFLAASTCWCCKECK
ncbi:hypothetical protein COU77_02355 [Candidatus Peregrinibacteria bacterium CG10_big_fil_rev_8_21_14_0_10_49_16]|nr:MAG: hypothetical protein COW95_00840 [Candidatus Peregrinibacteria bacterium CG22_combo_CG10-13_8_21_14_all_49_11]PIR52053.1 MAG: hypothetical protein COU77_02355 [Candidatus Peregrinibacteria bacterium CG10_big_fil_rev_8_21_14_0_10_49_16]